ncbi:PREDICTED: UDP-glycosyltransferase 79B4-like [Camelina sativa]|uniref:UDP-glycosyltransferase 79B4-like n=1 Tax=Camelina sativa TaxID=90675 RepID=A0ABM1RKU2_CAMSA|nr:PREDICTED: UDP-glycosyltransferase 79B4-like [Camelina sativa]
MGSKFHAILYPWFGFGHMIPYRHLANKLAKKGHRVTFLSPKKARKQLEALSLFPDNIYFYHVTLPQVDSLHVGAETTSDLPNSSKRVLADAMDLLRGQIEAEIRALKPDLIFFDFVDWIPEMAKELGIKSVSYQIVFAAFVAMFLAPGAELGSPPPGYPSPKVALRGHDANVYSFFANTRKFLFDRVTTGLKNSDVVAIRTCAEIEGTFCDFIERECQRKVLLTGPMLPQPQGKNDQFQELCLGLELTGLPFLVAVMPPRGSSTIQEALPEGFQEALFFCIGLVYV